VFVDLLAKFDSAAEALKRLHAEMTMIHRGIGVAGTPFR